MRKFIAMLLTVALLVTGYGSCFADRVKLPASLLTIEKEAFYGDTSIKEVVVPYGTQYIMARAFAYSGIEKIYIPDTVTFIASNAFDGADDVVICAPEGSYAAAFAEEYDYLSEGSKSMYLEDQMQHALELYNDFDDSDMFSELTDEGRHYYTLTTDGITDPETLECIAKYNSYIEIVKDVNSDVESKITDLVSGCNDLAGVMNDVSEEVSGNTTITKFGDYSFTITNDAAEGFDKNAEAISIYSDENGESLLIEFQSEGKPFYLRVSNGSVSLTSTISNQNWIEPNAYTTFNTVSFSIQNYTEYLKEKLKYLKTYSDKISGALNDLIKNAETKVELNEGIRENAKTIYHNCPPESDFYNYHQQVYIEAETQYHNSVKALRDAKRWGEFFDSINIPATVYDLIDDIAHLGDLYSIQKHGHPTQSESSSLELLEIVEKLVKDLGIGLGCYTARVILGCKRLFEQVSSLLSWISRGLPSFTIPAITVRAVVTVIFNIIKDTVLEYAFDKLSESFWLDVHKNDFKLHQYISGKITDEDTKQPIKKVKVTCEGTETYTDSKGNYTLSVSPGTHKITFSKKGYNDLEEDVVSEPQQIKVHNVTMSSKATLTGAAVDATNEKPLSGVTVICGNYKTVTDSSGKYSFKLKPGTAQISFSKDGYITMTDSVTTELNKENVYNAYMSEKLDPKWYRVVLSWGAAPRDLDAHLMQSGDASYHVYYASKSATNARLDHDNIESSAYGHFETVTFLADPKYRYQYWVHDYTNRGNSSSMALARSGAKIRVYCEDKMIGTYSVPNRNGVNWEVFHIIDGKFDLFN